MKLLAVKQEGKLEVESLHRVQRKKKALWDHAEKKQSVNTQTNATNVNFGRIRF